MLPKQRCRKREKGKPEEEQVVCPEESAIHMVQIVEQPVVGDPPNRANEETDGIRNEVRRQAEYCSEESSPAVGRA